MAPKERVAPDFSFATDPVVELLGLPALRRVGVPEGTTELRIWIGFGIVVPHLLLRLTKVGNTVQGELVRWWSAMDHPSEDARFGDFLAAQQRLAGDSGCVEAQSGDDWIEMREQGSVHHKGWTFACRADFGGDVPDWTSVFGDLAELGVGDLPDPSTLSPEPSMVADGTSVEVEFLRASQYHAYTYNNPDLQPWSEARVAEAIIDLVYELHARQTGGGGD